MASCTNLTWTSSKPHLAQFEKFAFLPECTVHGYWGDIFFILSIYIDFPQQDFFPRAYWKDSCFIYSCIILYRNHPRPIWPNMVFIGLRPGGHQNLTWPAKNQKKPIISPAWMYMAQHGFYGVVYQSNMDVFKTPSGPIWILWRSVPILHGPLRKRIFRQMGESGRGWVYVCLYKLIQNEVIQVISLKRITLIT